MKMKKLLLCMTTAFIVASTISENAFAAEVNTVQQTQNSEVVNEQANTVPEQEVKNEESQDNAKVDTDNQAEEVKKATTSDSDKKATTAAKETEKKVVKKETKKVKNTKTNKKKEVKKVAVSKKATKRVYSNAELRLLASIIYCEANGQSYAGKLAVGIVIMNRVGNRAFPNTVKGVIYQKSQFGPVRNGSLVSALRQYDNGKFTSAHEKECIEAAKAALSGTKVITYKKNGKTITKNMKGFYYFSGRLSNPKFTLGGHQFK